MMTSENMQRVGKQNPCPICGKSDWCLVAPDKSAAICPRTPDGSVKEIPGSGFLHILRDKHYRHKYRVNKRRLVTNVPIGNSSSRNFGQLAEHYKQLLTDDKLNSLATVLGVSAASLNRLNIGWDGKAYTFPMSNDFGKTIGIRRRFPNGKKVSVKGSKTGLFVPSGVSAESSLLLCEGPSDTAAALDLGFAGIGRPNCSSKILMMVEAARGRTEIVIVGDNDEVGRAGAEKLADALVLHYPCVKIVYPPDDIKDLRKWLQAGLTHETLQQIIKDAKSVELAINFKD